MDVRRQSEGQSATSLREAALVETMLVEVIGIVEQLSRDIVAEENRVQIFDENAPAYSTLAKSLKSRRDNLKSTIATLERRLSVIYRPRRATPDDRI